MRSKVFPVSLLAATGIASALALSGCVDPAVSNAIKAIDAIGDITVESREAIELANERCAAVDDELKPEVGSRPEIWCKRKERAGGAPPAPAVP